MEFLIKASQFILSLSFLIVLHELGHFIPARLFKIKVEKFYLFFNPWFSIFKKKRGDTEYGLGWLPLGGYVKIAGMIDESMDKEQLKKDPEPWEFRSKPAWQRLIVMVGGVTVNLILGFLIYIMVLFVWGRDTLPVAAMEDGYAVDSLMYEYGFRDGDIVTHVHGEPLQDAMEINKLVFVRGKTEFTVARRNIDTVITLPDDFQFILLEKGVGQPFSPRFKSSVDSVIAESPAEKAGLKKGDVIKKVNDVETPYWTDATRLIKGNVDAEILLSIHRPESNTDTVIALKTDETGKIGIAPENMEFIFDFEHRSYGFFEAIPAGISFGAQTLSDYAANLKFLFTSSGAKQIGGFGTIGGLFPPTWDWRSFWSLTAFLSIILAFMNILPIPALDGGHVVFLLYEMITGRKPNQKVMEYAQMVGMILLIGLILFANFNDIRRFLF
jgi:regulator of sigma E protease